MVGTYTTGCDIDGVLSFGFIPPEKEYVIISGRLYTEWDRTIRELGVSHPIYLRPFGAHGDRHAAGLWKSQLIRVFEITRFYEDDPLQAYIIQQANPDCKIILIQQQLVPSDDASSADPKPAGEP